MVQLDKQRFVNESKKMKDKYQLNTTEDIQTFAKENPELLQELVNETTTAFKESIIGKEFEELTEEEMLELQAAGGDVSPETTLICFVAGVGIGAVTSALKC